MKTRLIVLVTFLVVPWSAWGMDVPEVAVHGFVSQGYLRSTENNFLTKDSKEGTTQFNEVGLVVSSDVTDKLRIGAQLLSRDLGEVGNNEVNLDWGFADYRHNDYHGLRVGKVKLPFGLYNEGRDADMLRPMVFLPQSIYDESKRDLLVAYQGAGLYGNLPLGPLGDLDYHGYYGGINIDEDSLLVTALQQNATFTTRQSLASVLGPAFSPILTPAGAQAYIQQINVVDLDVNNDYIGGGSITYNTALEGLRLGGSVLMVKNDIDFVLNRSIDPTIDPTDPNQVFVPTRLSGTLENELTWVGSLEYGLGDFLLAGEYSETERKQVFNDVVALDATSQSYYVMGAYTFFDRLTLSLLYDVYYSDKDDKDGSAFVKSNPAQRKDFFTWRKDRGVGLRYDINPNWLIKAEYHAVDGAALFLTTVNDPADLEDKWDYYAVKMSFNF